MAAVIPISTARRSVTTYSKIVALERIVLSTPLAEERVKRIVNFKQPGAEDAREISRKLHNRPQSQPDPFFIDPMTKDQLVTAIKRVTSVSSAEVISAICQPANHRTTSLRDLPLNFVALPANRVTGEITLTDSYEDKVPLADVILAKPRRNTSYYNGSAILIEYLQELPIVACALARACGYDAFFSIPTLPKVRAGEKGTRVQDLVEPIEFTYGLGFAIITDKGELLHSTLLTLVDVSMITAPAVHPPVAEIEIVSDAVALTYARILAARSRYKSFNKELEENRVSSGFGPWKKWKMEIEELYTKLDHVFVPLKDAIKLTPEDGELFDEIGSYTGVLISYYYRGKLSPKETAFCFAKLFGIIKDGFEVLPNSEKLQELVLAIKSVLDQEAQESKINPIPGAKIAKGDYKLFIKTIKDAVGEHITIEE